MRDSLVSGVILLMTLAILVEGFFQPIKNQPSASDTTMRLRRSLRNASNEDVIAVEESISMDKFLSKFGSKMGERAGVGDVSLKRELKSMLYDMNHPVNDRYNNEYTRFTRMCRHLLQSDRIHKRVRRSTGHLPALAEQMKQACQAFIEDPSVTNLETLEDIDGEMIKEVICLERGMTFGIDSSCRSTMRETRSVLDDDVGLPKDLDVPEADEIDKFNQMLRKYCPEKDKYDHRRMRRSTEAGAMFSADMLEYINCLCDNQTNCGHLAFRAGKSFGSDIAEPVVNQMEEGIDEGKKFEVEHKTDDGPITPGNQTYYSALNEMGHAQTKLTRVKRKASSSVHRFDVWSSPVKQIGKAIGCQIVIHKDQPVQEFGCAFFKVLHVSITLTWTNILPLIELDISLCVPVLSDIVNFIQKYVKPLRELLEQFDIDGGCFLLARAYVDFYMGVFEVFSNVPQMSLILFRAKLRTAFLIRFDTSRPHDDKNERDELNKYGEKTFMEATSTFNVEYYEFWKLFWGSWKCVWCKTLLDKAWPLNDGPLVEDETPEYRLVNSTVEGTGRIEVKPESGIWGTVCNDGFGPEEGDVTCQSMGFLGYIGIWDDVGPGEGEIMLAGIGCKGTEGALLDCPRTKDLMSTGCQHSEDVGIQCLTVNSRCAEDLVRHLEPGQITSSSGDTSQLFLDSDGGWVPSTSAPGEWVQFDLWFTHKITGVRTQGHKGKDAYVTKFRVHAYNGTWQWNTDAAGDDVVYTGNVDQHKYKSNFWWPPLPAHKVKILIDEYHGEIAMRLELHGCVESLLEDTTTYQSSVLFKGFSSLAIDGNTNNHFIDGGSCTHTQEERNPWWAVDLKRDMKVEGLRITNRADCCGERLRDFLVEVGSVISPTSGVQGEICYEHPAAMSDGQRKLIRCEGTPRGRFLQIRKKGYGILTMCEVQVWASPASLDFCHDDVQKKVDCGVTSQSECEELGCCWSPGGSPQCYTVQTQLPTTEDCGISLFNAEPGTKVTASSEDTDDDGGNHGITRARLDTKVNAVKGPDYAHGGWSAAKLDKNQFIQVEFPETWTVRKIVTQGANSAEEWVTKYQVYYSFDGQYWSLIGGVYIGNKDADTKAVNEMQRFAAKYVRINPLEWYGWITMRFDVFGCKACEVSLVESAEVIFSSSTTNENEYGFGPHRARLDTLEASQPFMSGGWKANFNRQGEWIQVEFHGQRFVSKVVTQGAHMRNEFVKRYAVQHSNDGESFTKEGEYAGNTDNLKKVTTVIKNPFSARYVRLEVIEWMGAISMRFDLLGCNQEMTAGLHQFVKDKKINSYPSVFFVDEKLTYDAAQSKCKEMHGHLVDGKELSAANMAGFEAPCMTGWIDGQSIRSVLLQDQEMDFCGTAGIEDMGSPSPDKLAGAFCANEGGGLFYLELGGGCTDLTAAKRKCQDVQARIVDEYEGPGFGTGGYKECKLGWIFYHNYESAANIGCAEGMEGFNYDNSQECPPGVFCVLPALASGILPASVLRLLPVRHGLEIYNGDFPVYLPRTNYNQYLLGMSIDGDLFLKTTYIAEEPYTSGVLAPAKALEPRTSVGNVKFYHPICPEGFKSIGDVAMTDEMEKEGSNRVRTHFRCIRHDLVQKCTTDSNMAAKADGGTLWTIVPSQHSTQYSGTYFLASSSSSRPSDDDAYCISIGHSHRALLPLYEPFDPSAMPKVPYLITEASGTTLVYKRSHLSIFRPKLRPGEYMIGMVAMEGSHDTYTGSEPVWVATEQHLPNIMRPVTEFYRLHTGQGLTSFNPLCTDEYTALSSVVVDGEDVETPDEEIVAKFRCVRREYIMNAEYGPSIKMAEDTYAVCNIIMAGLPDYQINSNFLRLQESPTRSDATVFSKRNVQIVNLD